MYTEAPEMAITWLGEISYCSCLTFLPGLAWFLLSKTYKPFPGYLYMPMSQGKTYSANHVGHAVAQQDLTSEFYTVAQEDLTIKQYEAAWLNMI